MASKTGVARLVELAGERKGLLAVSALLSALGAACMLAPYASVYFILKELLEHAADPARADAGHIARWGLIALLGLAGGLASIYAGGMASHIAAFRILHGIRAELASRIGKLPLGWFNGTSTGAVKKTLDQNVEKIETFIAHQLPDLVHVSATVALMLAAMFAFDARLAAAAVVPIALCFVMQTIWMGGPRARENVRLYYDALERMNGSAVQYVRGMPAVKVFGQTVHSFRKFYKDMIAYRDYCVKYTDEFQNGYLMLKALLASFAAFVLPAGIFLLGRDPDNVAFASVLLFFLVMTPGVSAPMYKLVYMASQLKDINEGVERIDRIFAAQPIPETGRPQRPEAFDVRFEEVSFSYAADAGEGEGKGAETGEALANVSFVARQGEVTALVGPSGSGKSTAAHLLPRFWDVTNGAIRIGSVDIREMSVEELMNTVAFVFQETFLFYDTVYNNILAGRPDASAEDVVAAARAAQCHDFIGLLPQGYDTLIGEGGVYLSGGEEQRVAVARAILKNAPVLVLDEATAFADPENEWRIQSALKALAAGKTVIVIAHRLSAIRDADRIVVLREGSVAETGKHDELLAANGLYADMWRTHIGAAQWHIGGTRGGEAGREAGPEAGRPDEASGGEAP